MRWFLYGLGYGMYVMIWANFLGKPTILGIGWMLVGLILGIASILCW